MEQDQFMGIAFPLIIAIITFVSSAILYRIKISTDHAKAKLDGVLNDNDRKTAEYAINLAQDIISTAVTETNQILVDELKSKSADGKLSKEEIEQSFKTTYDRVYELTGTEIINVLGKLMPNIDEWVKSKIQFYVNINK